MWNYTWGSPWAFWLLPVLVALVVWQYLRRQKKRPTFLFSQVAVLKQSPRGARVYVSWLPEFLKIGSLALAIVALARPRVADSHVKQYTRGIDIMLALDISGSMEIEDMDPLSRINAAKKVLTAFIKSRPNDRIGLVIFKSEAYTRVPLTLDHQLLVNNLRGVDPTNDDIQDGTAIGSALALATARLKDSTAKSKVIILATDGENNSGTISPETALDIAKGYGIRIYTIGMGKDGESMMPVYGTDVFGNRVKQYQQIHSSINIPLLTKMAKDTGGAFYRATSGASLANAFRSIDHLEKSKIEEQQYVEYRDVFPRFLKVALVMLLMGMLLERTILSRYP